MSDQRSDTSGRAIVGGIGAVLLLILICNAFLKDTRQELRRHSCVDVPTCNSSFDEICCEVVAGMWVEPLKDAPESFEVDLLRPRIPAPCPPTSRRRSEPSTSEVTRDKTRWEEAMQTVDHVVDGVRCA